MKYAIYFNAALEQDIDNDYSCWNISQEVLKHPLIGNDAPYLIKYGEIMGPVDEIGIDGEAWYGGINENYPIDDEYSSIGPELTIEQRDNARVLSLLFMDAVTKGE